MKRQPCAVPPRLESDRWWDLATLQQPEVALRQLDRHPLMLALILVYVLLGVLAYRLGLVTSSLEIFFAFLAGSTLLKLTWIDLRLQLLPNILVGWLLLIGLAALVCQPHSAFQLNNLLLGFVLGGGFFALLAWGFQALTGRSGLGMGDIKLLAVLGLWVGASGLPLLLLLASWASLPVVGWLRWQGLHNQRFAFGPMLCLAGWSVLLFQAPLWQFLATLTGHTN